MECTLGISTRRAQRQVCSIEVMDREKGLVVCCTLPATGHAMGRFLPLVEMTEEVRPLT
jgi:hypothetical protein